MFWLSFFAARANKPSPVSHVPVYSVDIDAMYSNLPESAVIVLPTQRGALDPRKTPVTPASWVLIPCDNAECCHGSVLAVTGSYYDHALEQYFPLEKLVPCPRCDGAGVIEVSYDAPELEQAA